MNYIFTHVFGMFPHDNQLRIPLNMTRWCGRTELSHDSVHILVDIQHHNILDHMLLKTYNVYLYITSWSIQRNENKKKMFAEQLQRAILFSSQNLKYVFFYDVNSMIN